MNGWSEPEGPIPMDGKYPEPHEGFRRWTEGLPVMDQNEKRYTVYLHHLETGICTLIDYDSLDIAKRLAIAGEGKVFDKKTNSWFEPRLDALCKLSLTILGGITLMEKQMSVSDVKSIQSLFGLSHDLIAQAQYPGHLSAKVAEAINFLKFQYEDFDRRVKAMEGSAQAAEVLAVDKPMEHGTIILSKEVTGNAGEPASK